MGQAMIVTCDHCGTRYKLDASKIPGRGARVTCPSCRHVFVVYRSTEAEAAPPPAADATLKPGRPKPAAAPRPAAPPKPAGPTIAEEVAELDINDLSFRDVGIGSWKVKVKIGLVYDFNDFKTLNKYIREGRVTGSDLLSHDGASWIPIQDIEDLERHFLETFVRARRAQNAAEEPEETFEDEPTRIMEAGSVPTPDNGGGGTPVFHGGDSGGDDDLAAAFAAAEAEADGGAPQEPERTGRADGGRRFVDPFEAQQKASRKRAAEAARRPAPKPLPPKPGNNNAMYGLIAVALLLLVGGGVYYSSTNGANASGNPNPNATAGTNNGAGSGQPPAPQEDQEAEALRQRLLQRAEDEAAVNVPEPEPVEEDQQLIPVGPDEEYLRQQAARGSEVPGLEGSFSVGGATSGDLVQSAGRAAANGNWSQAAREYKKALSQDPNNITILERLGEAQYESGDLNGASGTLQRAAGMGSSVAHKFLGHIAVKQGDDGGALASYRLYLTSNPSDRQDIQRRIDAIHGG